MVTSTNRLNLTFICNFGFRKIIIMKNLILLLFVVQLFSCSGPQEPVFKRVTNVSIDKITGSTIYVSGSALFHNPNSVGGTLKDINIDVWANDTEVGKIAQPEDVLIKSNSEFTIPLKIDFPLKKITKNQKGLLSSVLDAVLNKKVTLDYKGAFTFAILGVNVEVPIEYQEEVPLKY